MACHSVNNFSARSISSCTFSAKAQEVLLSGSSARHNLGTSKGGTILVEASTRSLLIKAEVLTGTCGTTLVNTATLTAVNEDETPSTNNQASASVKVVPENGACPVRDQIVEVHCEKITHNYSTSGVLFDTGGFTFDSRIVGGTGLRLEMCML